MDSVSDLVGVTVVVTMVAWGWAATREARRVLFPPPEREDDVISLP